MYLWCTFSILWRTLSGRETASVKEITVRDATMEFSC